jgi:hypothetical protein
MGPGRALVDLKIEVRNRLQSAQRELTYREDRRVTLSDTVSRALDALEREDTQNRGFARAR